VVVDGVVGAAVLSVAGSAAVAESGTVRNAATMRSGIFNREESFIFTVESCAI
jgi:hypothetical protein